ncbi:hypothetical protein Sinac_2504 [Singulisphaera acidiphila DSM 18658]|uniref:Uncharacterized protein n=1 Tax=Singulisphaera acidiphila (strain ATCC BAA-1392 / DSM 18658 / VKM B-2454 / MOB10) TaxID=886293 RepID=L0DC44_SINAD|nr:hypothetical protein Sinac_2504 [Singulisphaera acidiphila DSM 18658]
MRLWHTLWEAAGRLAAGARTAVSPWLGERGCGMVKATIWTPRFDA